MAEQPAAPTPLDSEASRSFMDHLCRDIAEVLGLDIVFVGRLLPSGADVEVEGGWRCGAPVGPMAYALAGTPCEQVMGKATCCFPSGVQAQFPDDTLLQVLGIDGYVGRPLFGADGRPTGIIVGLHSAPIPNPGDITRLFDASAARVASEVQRALAERALRASEAKYRALVEGVPGAVYQCELEAPWRVSHMSRGCVAVAGWQAEDFTSGRIAWGELVVPGDLPALERAVAEAVAARVPYEVDYRIRHRDGDVRWVHETGQALVDEAGRPQVLQGVIVDVTERLAAEQALRVGAAQMLATLEHTPNVAIQWYDEEGRVCFWNRASAHVYGWTREEALGRTLDQLMLSPGDAAAFTATLAEIRASGRPAGPYEIAITRKDGSTGWVVATTFGMPVEAGGTRYVCMDVDITERRRAEEALIQAQKLEAVGRLAGGVAHDFNNMLNVILGHMELVLEDRDGQDPLTESLREVQVAAQRAADLTRQLLAFARRQTATPRVLDLNHVVETLLKMLRRLIGEHIALVWRPGHDLWAVCLDPSQLDQILTNLCVNARDAIGASGRVTIATVNTSLDESACAGRPGWAPGDYVELSVEDTGCGMDAETLARVFEPFFTTKQLGKGTGLGLSTVYGIVAQNHGIIAAESEVGRGSRFRLYLPRHAGDGARADGVEPARSARLESAGTVLIVEDEAAVLQVARSMLERSGFTVHAASTPAEAMRIAGSVPVDVLVTDVVMPDMDGVNLARLLTERIPDLQCLFVSGYSADVLANSGLVVAPVRVIEKPFTSETLTSAVGRVLDEKRAAKPAEPHDGAAPPPGPA